MVTLHYTITKDDYSQYFYHQVWFSPGKKNKAIKLGITRFLQFAVMLSLVKFVGHNKTIDPFFLFSLFTLACIFLLPLFSQPATYRKFISGITENALNANIFTEIQISISETGMSSRSNFAEAKYQWAAIIKKEENKDYYFLYLSSEQAILLPKRAIRSQSEKEQLEKLFAEHISFNAEVGHLVKD